MAKNGLIHNWNKINNIIIGIIPIKASVEKLPPYNDIRQNTSKITSIINLNDNICFLP
jgi:hypothetical protein